MEPFTMMLGYGLVNSLSQLVIRPIADKMSSPTRRAEMQQQMETKHILDLEAVRLNKQIELDNQRNIQELCHQLRLQEAKSQFERQLQMWQIGQFNDKMWPLLTPFDHPSLYPQFAKGHQVPINIFLAKTDPHSPFAALIQSDLKNKLATFIQTAYTADPFGSHPSICRIGDWKDGFQDAAFINALWFGLQGQPSIVVNPIQSEFGEILDLNVSIWGLGESGLVPTTRNVISGHFGSAIGRIKRDETRLWIEHGLPVSSPEMKYNADLLKQEEALAANGNGDYIDHLLVQYKLPKEIQNRVITKFANEYNHIVSCVSGMFADIYHLVEYGAQPYMPLAINSYNKVSGKDFQIPDVVIEHYRHALTTMVCTNYLQDRLPTVYMGVARAVNFNAIQSLEIFNEGVGLWFNKKLDLSSEKPLPVSIDESLRLLRDHSGDRDKNYLEEAKATLLSLNLREEADTLTNKIFSLVTPADTSKADSPPQSSSLEWRVEERVMLSNHDFEKWIGGLNSSVLSSARYAILMVRDGFYAIMLADESGKYTPVDNDLGGICIVAQRSYMPLELIDSGFVIYDLKYNNYSNANFMENNEFKSFEKLGKQLDALINNISRIPASMNSKKGQPQQNNTHATASRGGLEQQLTEIFMNRTNLGIEKENTQVAEFDLIRNWITSKLPVPDATKVHIFKTDTVEGILVCVFFTDDDMNTLLGNGYPSKSILCSSCDSDMEAFLNGLSIGTITL